MKGYHKVTKQDCLSVATKKEKVRLSQISDLALMKALANLWCSQNSYKLGGYLGKDSWDATELDQG